jgi:hypothetical protein
MSMNIFYTPILGNAKQIGVVPGLIVAETPEELDELVKGGFSNDQQRLTNFGIAKDCYNGNFQSYLADWTQGDVTRENSARFSLIMRRTVDVLSTHLYRKGPKRTISGHPEATAILERIYSANNFDTLMQMGDRTTFITDSAAVEFVPNDGIDAITVPVKIRLWDAAEFIPVFDTTDSLNPWAVATLSVFGDRKVARVFTADYISMYSSPIWNQQQTASATQSAATQAQSLGMTQNVGYPIPNYLGVLPFEFMSYELPRNSFWTGGIGLQLAHMNLHINRRLSDLADNIIQWRPKGVLRNVKPDWNFPPNQKPGQFTRLDGMSGIESNNNEPIAEFIAPDLTFTQYDWNDISAYSDHMVEMLGVPASTVRMQQQGGTSGVAIMSEQLPLIERAEARQRIFDYFEQRIAKKCLMVAMAQLQNATPQDEMTAMMIQQDIMFIQAAMTDFDNAFHEVWPIMTKNRPGPERDAHDAFQLNFQRKSRTEMTAEDENISIDEAFAKTQQTMSLIMQENMLLAQAQMPLMPPPAENPPETGEAKNE